MVNKQRAEVAVTLSDGSEHKFRMGTAAICKIEEKLNVEVLELFNQLQKSKIRLGAVREFVKASSVTDPDMDDDAACALMDDVGVIPLLNAMTDSILATFNIPEEKKANPPKPVREVKSGTGNSRTLPKSA